MRQMQRRLVALFLILLMVSTSVAALGFAGSQNNVEIGSPTGYESPEVFTYFIVDGKPAEVAQICAVLSQNEYGCSADCDKRQNYLDLYRLKGIDPILTSYSSRELNEANLREIVNNLNDHPDVSLEPAWNSEGSGDYGQICFNSVRIYDPGYYLIRIGAFGSPERGGVSSSYATGFMRVLEKDTRACLNDGVVVQAGGAAERHQYLCNADYTYKRCKPDGSDYEEPGLCRQECGALSGCTDLKPNPDCVNSCISEGGAYKIVSDSASGSIRIEIPLPDNGQAVVVISDTGVITGTDVNNVPATSQNVPATNLIGEILQNSNQIVDTTIPKNTVLQDPSVEVVLNDFNIESFEIGNGEFTTEGTAVNGYTPFQKIALDTAVNGTPEANVSVVLYFIKVEGTGDNQLEGDRNLMLAKELKLDGTGKANLTGEKFFAVLPDGVYKPMLELYQAKELRQVSWWVQNGKPGLIAIAFDPEKFKAKIDGDMGSLAEPPSAELEGLFNDFMTARKDALANNNWPDGALPAFKAFIEQYLHRLYPNQADYDRAAANLLGDDQKLKDTMLQFVEEVVAPVETEAVDAEKEAMRMYYDNYFLDGIYYTGEIATKAYQVRIDSFTQPWYKVLGNYALMVISLDIINILRTAIKAGYSDQDKAIIQYKQDQITQIGGSFSESRNVNSNQLIFNEFYPKMADTQSTSNEEINSIMGVQLGSTDIDRLRKPFYDYVLTRDLMKSISDDNLAAVAYGWGWMYFYSGLTAYRGDPLSYTDYPLRLSDGGSVTRETYANVPKAERDSIPGPGNVWTAIANNEADLVMYETLYTAAANSFVAVKTEYASSSDYVALANERLDDIKTIRTTQNIVKGLELFVGAVLALAGGSLVARGLGAVIRGAVEGAGILSKLAGKVPGAFNLLINLARTGGYAAIGINAWKLYTNCYRYWENRGSLSEAEQVMDSGWWIERCVEPGLRFATAVVNLGMIEKNIQQSGGNQFKPQTRGGRLTNWLLSRMGTASSKWLLPRLPHWWIFGFSKTPASAASEIQASLPKPAANVNAETSVQLGQGIDKYYEILSRDFAEYHWSPFTPP
jgi:hypothetical protein